MGSIWFSARGENPQRGEGGRDVNSQLFLEQELFVKMVFKLGAGPSSIDTFLNGPKKMKKCLANCRGFSKNCSELMRMTRPFQSKIGSAMIFSQKNLSLRMST